jgi:hypothetical protein
MWYALAAVGRWHLMPVAHLIGLTCLMYCCWHQELGVGGLTCLLCGCWHQELGVWRPDMPVVRLLASTVGSWRPDMPVVQLLASTVGSWRPDMPVVRLLASRVGSWRPDMPVVWLLASTVGSWKRLPINKRSWVPRCQIFFMTNDHLWSRMGWICDRKRCVLPSCAHTRHARRLAAFLLVGEKCLSWRQDPAEVLQALPCFRILFCNGFSR